jgi:hypothetical protein
MSRELVKHTFFPFLKYRKNKDTNKIDYTSPPSFSAKVPFYRDNNQWAVELYDVNSNLIFPSEDKFLNPSDFVPKMSQVACLIQCSGLWIGGKGWGLTWKLIQAVVRPKENESIYGVCQISLSSSDRKAIDNNFDESSYKEPVLEVEAPKEKKPVDTIVEDSDEEAETEVEAPATEVEAEVEPPVEKVAPVFAKAKAAAPAEPAAAAAPPKVVKKVIKKKVTA